MTYVTLPAITCILPLKDLDLKFAYMGYDTIK